MKKQGKEHRQQRAEQQTGRKNLHRTRLHGMAGALISLQVRISLGVRRSQVRILLPGHELRRSLF